MRLSQFIMLIPIVLLALAAPPTLFSQDVLPRCTSVEPSSGKPGDAITVTGENLGKAIVAELYFTDGKNDIKVAMSEQSDTTIKTAIPAGAKVGIRYRLMVLTKGKEPRLIEQPVRVEIVE
jgi:hypothetical protein